MSKALERTTKAHAALSDKSAAHAEALAALSKLTAELDAAHKEFQAALVDLSSEAQHLVEVATDEAKQGNGPHVEQP